MMAHRSIYTDPSFDMTLFLKKGNTIRVMKELYKVEGVDADRIRLERIWRGDDAEGVILFKMVLTRPQKMRMQASRLFWRSELVQYFIQLRLVVEEDLVNKMLLRRIAVYSKKRRKKRIYAIVKRKVKDHEKKIHALKLLLNSSQFGMDRPHEKGGEEDEGKRTVDDAYMDNPLVGWVERIDKVTGRTTWQNTATGDIRLTKPDGMAEKQRMQAALDQQKQLLAAKKARQKRG
ncbi:unnamed protein product [Discosporangium mesarthrocarpum]